MGQPQRHTSQEVPSRPGVLQNTLQCLWGAHGWAQSWPLLPSVGTVSATSLPGTRGCCSPLGRSRICCPSFPLASHRSHTWMGVGGRFLPTPTPLPLICTATVPNRSLELWFHHGVNPTRTQTAELCYEDSEAGEKHMHINARAEEHKGPEASGGSGIRMSKGSEGRARTFVVQCFKQDGWSGRLP